MSRSRCGVSGCRITARSPSRISCAIFNSRGRERSSTSGVIRVNCPSRSGGLHRGTCEAMLKKTDAFKNDAVIVNDPLWYKDAVIYQLHVKSFFDANNDGIGDFAGLLAKLDYI